MAQKMLAHLKGRPNELVIFVVFFSEGFVRVTSGKNNEDSFDTLCVEPTCFVYLVVNQCKYEHQIVDEVSQVP